MLVPGDVLAPWIEDGGGHACQEVTQHGGALRLFSTNDYLGLSTHLALRRAAADAAMLYGVGVWHSFLILQSILYMSTSKVTSVISRRNACMPLLTSVSLCAPGPRSSAVVGGYTLLHQELERRLAALKGTEECLVFPTGFAANLAVVSALGSGEDAAIFSDELNHASIVDGARLASRNKAHLPLCTDGVLAPLCNNARKHL